MTGIYVFDQRRAHGRHRHLSAAHDPLTRARLAETGVGDGWHCLDVGAGDGEIARWLADRVAPSGSVLATDVRPNPRSRPPVVEHDVVTDPLSEEAFDLVVARLVLRHLPEREAVLAKLVSALKPGGWLQIDEFDTSYEPLLLAGDAESALLYEKFLAAKATAMRAAGVGTDWGRQVPLAMHLAGLVEIDPHPQVQLRHPGSPDLLLLVQSTVDMHAELVSAGMTAGELDQVREIVRHPDFRATSCLMYSVHGRKPAR
ncbi:methyltransferase domain-containing protein [Saccharopolyspora sp. NPDC047091]|uniref:class I SAM-dependent methyltransferase n=1 Tax=Saccharopolyspora sp. NPDC047091 TaxID=3155924 RepID=UPI0033C05001